MSRRVSHASDLRLHPLFDLDPPSSPLHHFLQKRGKEDDEDSDEPKGGRPGPTDEGGEGGMATREHTPDVDESSEEPTA